MTSYTYKHQPIATFAYYYNIDSLPQPLRISLYVKPTTDERKSVNTSLASNNIYELDLNRPET